MTRKKSVLICGSVIAALALLYGSTYFIRMPRGHAGTTPYRPGNVKILHVRQITYGVLSSTLSFDHGEDIVIYKTQSDYDEALSAATRDLEPKYPVGLLIDRNKIIAIDGVPGVRQIERMNDRYDIVFGGYAGIYHLRKDHPECARASYETSFC